MLLGFIILLSNPRHPCNDYPILVLVIEMFHDLFSSLARILTAATSAIPTSEPVRRVFRSERGTESVIEVFRIGRKFINFAFTELLNISDTAYVTPLIYFERSCTSGRASPRVVERPFNFRSRNVNIALFPQTFPDCLYRNSNCLINLENRIMSQ